MGRPLELGFLEAMLPVHRVAHPAIDAEGRHVGESNVFPDSMRMKRSRHVQWVEQQAEALDREAARVREGGRCHEEVVPLEVVAHLTY